MLPCRLHVGADGPLSVQGLARARWAPRASANTHKPMLQFEDGPPAGTGTCGVSLGRRNTLTCSEPWPLGRLSDTRGRLRLARVPGGPVPSVGSEVSMTEVQSRRRCHPLQTGVAARTAAPEYLWVVCTLPLWE